MSSSGGPSASADGLQRFEVLDQIRSLLRTQVEREQLLVVRNDGTERRRTSIVKVWRMLEETAEWCRSILLGDTALSVCRILAHLCRHVKPACIHIGKERPGVTARASSCAVEDRAPARCGRGIERTW